jgi:hypothetical protein
MRMVVLVAFGLSSPLLTQQTPTGSQTQSGEIESNTWTNAKPYLDDPLPKLQAAMPELRGLDPASSQEQLPSFLDRAGEKCVDLSLRTPNLISREEVITLAPAPPRAGFSLHPYDGIETQTFDYLLLSEQTSSGMEFHEYRSLHGQPVSPNLLLGVSAQGFISEWLRLYPGNRSESRFRYLGQQVVEKHQTAVLAFAQIPGSVKFPATFTAEGVSVPMLLQGILWLDSSDFRIVRIREDLLAPQSDAHLKKFTVMIRFGEVHIAKAASSLWVPQQVVLDWEFNGKIVQRRHRYSDYHLYTAKARILPPDH